MRVIVVATAICLSTVGLSAADDARAAIRMPTNIPAQRLGSALETFAQSRDLQVLYFSQTVRDIRTAGASGELTADETLTQLLSGTGLVYRYIDDKAVTILPAGATSRAVPTKSDDQNGASDVAKEGKKSSSVGLGSARVDQGANSQGASLGSNASASQQSSKGPAQLEEIIVTAQKRNQRLQDVPVPVTAISAEPLVASNQLRLQDFFSAVPGLSVTPANQSTQLLSIRGITTGGVSNPTVGVTVDDVPYGASTNVGGALVVPDIDPGDLVRVEVLRGPQGTLYGASSMGGLLKFVTVDPSTEGFSGRVEGGVNGVHNGAEAGYNIRGSINVPVGDTFAVRASAFTHQDPGYIDNRALGIDGINEERVSGGRLSGLWRPSETLSLKLNAMYQDARGDGSNVIEAPTPVYPQTANLGELQQNDLRGTGGYDRKVQAYSATLAAKLGVFDLTAISGYNVNQFRDSFDFSYAYGSYAQALFGVGGVPILNYSKTNKFTQEVRLTVPIGERVEWLIGTFYTHESSVFAENIAAADPATGAVLGSLIYVPIPTKYEEYAGFTNLTFHLSDQFDIQIGGRESGIKQLFSETESGAIFGSAEVTIPQEHTNASAFTYLVTPRFKVTPDVMIYARLASGYRAGGSNALPGSGTPPQYSPDKTQDYDLGVKGEFLDHVLSIDASLYYIDWKDIQLQLFNPATSGDYNTNGGRAKSQGMEFSIQVRPFVGMTAAAWVTWDDAVLTQSFPSGSTAVGASGDRLPNTSKFSGNLSLDDEFPLSATVSGFVGSSVSYIGSREGVFTSSPQRQFFPAYAKTDLRGGAKYDSWTATLYVNNVADKRGLISGGLGVYPPFGFYVIQPRTVGLSVTKTFF
jgi:outer membrane receptor protein involved in Fe transport